MFFSGALPLYRNGVLVGGLGIRSDGVEQDDFLTAAGTTGFEAPGNIRAIRSSTRACGCRTSSSLAIPPTNGIVTGRLPAGKRTLCIGAIPKRIKQFIIDLYDGLDCGGIAPDTLEQETNGMSFKLRKVMGPVVLCGFVGLSATAWAADAGAGEAVYGAKCRTCHGPDGEGNPASAKALKVEMKPLSEAAAKSEADLKKVITEG